MRTRCSEIIYSLSARIEISKGYKEFYTGEKVRIPRWKRNIQTFLLFFAFLLSAKFVELPSTEPSLQLVCEFKLGASKPGSVCVGEKGEGGG